MTGDASCPRCGETSKLSIWPFSDQALAALVVWGELEKKVVGNSTCNECYEELREVLIDRQDEINNPQPPEKIKIAKAKTPAKVAKKAAKKAKAAPKKKPSIASKVKKKIAKVVAKKAAKKKKKAAKKDPARKLG